MSTLGWVLLGVYAAGYPVAWRRVLRASVADEGYEWALFALDALIAAFAALVWPALAVWQWVASHDLDRTVRLVAGTTRRERDRDAYIAWLERDTGIAPPPQPPPPPKDAARSARPAWARDADPAPAAPDPTERGGL